MRWYDVLLRLIFVFALTLLQNPAVGQPTANTTSEIDFYRDAQPILSAHCFECHGPTQQLGGLRLDNQRDAERGGFSGASILGPAEENVLISRITEDDPAIRMPKDRPALSDRQVQTLTAWIAAGATWPDPPKRTPPPTILFGLTVPDWLVEMSKSVEDTLGLHPFGRPLLYLFLAANVGILLIERKKRALAEANVEEVAASARHNRVGRIGWMHYGAGYFVCAVALMLGIFWGGWKEAEKNLEKAMVQLDETSQKLLAATSTSIPAIFGDPPVPFRPSHGPTLSRVSGSAE